MVRVEQTSEGELFWPGGSDFHPKKKTFF